MKELEITNKNRRGGIDWKEYAEKYNSIGELGNFGFDIREGRKFLDNRRHWGYG